MKIYQNIPGVDVQNINRADSKFWNEGKWENFIAPLLPENVRDQTFVEMGCNAGLFLKLAQDKGFRNVVGIEKDKTPVSEGLRYRDSIGYTYKILKRTLGINFDFDEIPVADITLMSTFHYYIDINTWLKYLDRLRGKTCYVLIVSRDVKKEHWKASGDYEDIKSYFADWKETRHVSSIPVINDPSPRDLWSAIFRNPLLERMNIKDIQISKDAMQLAMEDLASKLSKREIIQPHKLSYYQEWEKRKGGKWSENKIKDFVFDKIKVMTSVMEDGLLDPLIIQKDNKLSDGGHRLAMLKALGYTSVLIRRA